MENDSFQQQVITGRLSLPAVIILAALLCFFIPETKPVVETEYSSLWEVLNKYFVLNDLVLRIINFCLFLFAGLSMLIIDHAYSLIRIRTTIPAVLFVLMFALSINMHTWQPTSIIVILVVFSLYFLMRSYQQRRPMGNIYHAWGLLGFASLLFPDLIILIPLYLIGEYIFQSLTLKSFFAGILGFCVPYLVLYTYMYLTDQMWLVNNYTDIYNSLTTFNFSYLQGTRVVMLGFIVFVNLVSIINFMINNHMDNIKTRDYLFFVVWLGIFLLALIILRPQYFNIYYSLLLIVNSIFVGHFFAVSNTKVTNLFFTNALFVSVVIYVCSLFL
jgi:hypothetical protein